MRVAGGINKALIAWSTNVLTFLYNLGLRPEHANFEVNDEWSNCKSIRRIVRTSFIDTNRAHIYLLDHRFRSSPS